jgi:hypothetical protein
MVCSEPTPFRLTAIVLGSVKVQLGPLPGGVTFSATAGLGFPIGASRARSRNATVAPTQRVRR